MTLPINALHKHDVADQLITPTIMVPKRSDLPELEIGKTRLLIGSSGLFLDTRTPWGCLTKQLWHCPRATPLPYGKVLARDDFQNVLFEHVMPLVSEVMVPEAAEYAEKGKEWGGFIVWDGFSFIPWAVAFEASPTSLSFTDRAAAALPEGYSLVADIHSHATIPPFFSAVDNLSDNGRVKLSIVLGNYRVESGQPLFDWKARYCVEGFFFGNGEADDDAFSDSLMPEEDEA